LIERAQYSTAMGSILEALNGNPRREDTPYARYVMWSQAM